MVPTDVHILAILPMLASGKVDKRALAAHHASVLESQLTTTEGHHGEEIRYVFNGSLQQWSEADK
jgi:hypothetical protein